MLMPLLCAEDMAQVEEDPNQDPARWGLMRGTTQGVDDHLTMEPLEQPDGTMMLVPPLPDTVLTWNEPTPGYCCPLVANTYGIEFERFHIRNMADGQILFEVRANAAPCHPLLRKAAPSAWRLPSHIPCPCALRWPRTRM